MLLRIIETDGSERIISCKAFDFRTDQALIRIKFEDGEIKEIRNILRLKCVS